MIYDESTLNEFKGALYSRLERLGICKYVDKDIGCNGMSVFYKSKVFDWYLYSMDALKIAKYIQGFVLNKGKIPNGRFKIISFSFDTKAFSDEIAGQIDLKGFYYG